MKDVHRHSNNSDHDKHKFQDKQITVGLFCRYILRTYKFTRTYKYLTYVQ